MLKTILIKVIEILDSCHVAGSEAKRYGEAIEMLREVLKVLNMSKESENNDHHDEQGKDA